MQKQTSAKTAFQPLRPSETALDAALKAAEAKAAKPPTPPPAQNQAPKQPPKAKGPGQTPPQPAPPYVEIWLEIVSRPDRVSYSWCFFIDRPHLGRGIVIALNVASPVVRQAIDAKAAPFVAVLISVPLAEALIFRRKQNKWLEPTFEQLRKILDIQPGTFGTSWLSAAIAASAPFRAISSELVAAESNTETGRKTLIATVDLGGKPWPCDLFNVHG